MILYIYLFVYYSFVYFVDFIHAYFEFFRNFILPSFFVLLIFFKNFDLEFTISKCIGSSHFKRIPFLS